MKPEALLDLQGVKSRVPYEFVSNFQGFHQNYLFFSTKMSISQKMWGSQDLIDPPILSNRNGVLFFRVARQQQVQQVQFQEHLRAAWELGPLVSHPLCIVISQYTVDG